MAPVKWPDTICRDPPRASSPEWSGADSEEEIMTSDRICELNDALRRTFSGGRIMMTNRVDALPDDDKAAVLNKVRSFNDFDGDNDPYGQHDFGNVEHDGIEYFFKIDYYAPDMQCGSEDPADPKRTVRVLTIMRADEY
jgi:hypothetical protein